MLQFLHVGQRLGEKWLFADLSLEVRAGELVWLSGNRGSGKSALIDLALGLVAPTAGSVLISGASLSRAGFAERQRIRRGIGLVQDSSADETVPAESWFALGPWCAGQPWERSLGAAREFLGRAGMLQSACLPFSEFSRGERALLTAGRALARRPHLLLVDWPGFFEDPLPKWLAEDFRKFLADGGAMMVTGGPEGEAAEWGGRTVPLDAPEGALK